ncbi:MAG: type II toxin-antitoxin system YafQ family toxin [Candidatus Gracilibacteria bacterium]
MLKITHSNRFKKDFRRLARSGRFDLKLFNSVVNQLASNLELAKKYEDHALQGELKKFRECHLAPDLLLIYSKDMEVLTLFLFRIGNHSELFR